MAVILRRPFNRPAYYASRWGLQAYWNLQDVNDAYANAQTLTNNAGVTFTAGKIGNNATFVNASQQYLSRANDAALQTGGVSFWAACWVNINATGSTRGIMAKWQTGPIREWSLDYVGANCRFTLRKSDGSDITQQTANLTAGVYSFLLAYFDLNNSIIGISKDGGNFATAACPLATLSSTSPLTIGLGAGSAASSTWDGQIALAAFGRNPPGGMAGVASEIRDTLYNANVGRTWPF